MLFLKSNQKTNDNSLRKLSEPMSGRWLSLEEVAEIEANLKAFAQVILKIAGKRGDYPSTHPFPA